MNLTTSLMQSEWARALGWTFVHSLWQIALVGLVLYVVLRNIPGKSAHVRYTISTMALWLIVVMALSTFLIMLPAPVDIKGLSGQLVLMTTPEPLTMTEKITAWLEWRMPVMLTIWTTGVAILMARLALSISWISHIKSTSSPNEDLQQRLEVLLQRINLKVTAKASDSSLVKSPLTVGHLKPMILFPVGIINQLAPSEVEAILAHELAHIVRRDYLSNIIQSIIETVFYYHPVTWWISGTVRTERENRADDLAVSWYGDHFEYAKALMTVQEINASHNTSLAIGFASGKGAMLSRIQRILNLPHKNHHQMEKTVLLSLSSLCFLAFTFAHPPKSDQHPAIAQDKETTVTLEVTRTDSIPSKGTYRIHKKTDDQDIMVEVQDGDIRELKVDGKEVDPGEFDVYAPVIEDLFGGMEAPRMPDGLQFIIPDIPPMPDMPMLEDFYFEMPEMPEIPGIHLDMLLDNGQTIISADSIFMRYNDGNVTIISDSLPDGQSRIIIYHDGDSSMIWTPGTPAQAEGWKALGEVYRLDAEQMRHNMQIQREAMREMNDHFRSQEREYAEGRRAQADEMRKQQQAMREAERYHFRWDEKQMEELERELAPLREMEIVYGYGSPRTSLSDQMVQDGLIQPGEEAQVQLTPDKMKVNGEKMPDAIHEKYLKMYELQQGVELSGNSRVEFTTKSKQRM